MIKDAKKKYWKELVETLDKDPWGRPCRLVLGKIRPKALPITEAMGKENLDKVLETLFPTDEEEVKEGTGTNQRSNELDHLPLT